MATNDAADMCLSMKIPLLSLKVEDKDVRDHFDIMHLAKDGKKHLENNGNKYLNNNVHTYKLHIYVLYACNAYSTYMKEVLHYSRTLI